MCVISFKVSELMEFDDSTFIVCPEFFVIQLGVSLSGRRWQAKRPSQNIHPWSIPTVFRNSDVLWAGVSVGEARRKRPIMDPSLSSGRGER